MVHGDESPVGDNSGHAEVSVLILAGNQVLNGGSVEKLDVGELKNLGEKGGGEESGVLDDDVLVLGLVGDTDLLKEGLGGLVGRGTHDHGGEELSSQPGTTTFFT